MIRDEYIDLGLGAFGLRAHIREKYVDALHPKFFVKIRGGFYLSTVDIINLCGHLTIYWG